MNEMQCIVHDFNFSFYYLFVLQTSNFHLLVTLLQNRCFPIAEIPSKLPKIEILSGIRLKILKGEAQPAITC